MADESDLLGSVADDIERRAPTISLDEVRAHAERQARPVVDGRRQRWPVLLVGAAAVAAIVVGGVLVTRRADEPTMVRTGTPDTTPSSEVVESVAPIPSAPTAESVPDTVAPPSSVPALVPTSPPAALDISTQLADIEAQRIERLRVLPGFSAKAIVETTTTGNQELPPTTREADIWLLADGTFWFTSADGGFGSYDPATGTTRGAFRGLDGSMQYDLIEGWSDNSTPVNIVIGTDPARLFGDPTEFADVAISRSETNGRSMTEVRITYEMSDGQSQVETYLIDDPSGLIVRSSTESVSSDGTVSRTESRLEQLTVVDQVPPEFPGEFPEGATINRSGNPNGFVPLGIDEAAAWFGAGFVGPPTLPEGTTVSVSEYPATDDQGVEYGVQRLLEIRTREGFVTTVAITIFATIVHPDATVPGDQVVVEGRACPVDPDTGGCQRSPTGQLVAAGALAGSPATFGANDASVQRDGIQWIVRTVDGSAADVLEGLVEW